MDEFVRSSSMAMRKGMSGQHGKLKAGVTVSGQYLKRYYYIMAERHDYFWNRDDATYNTPLM